MPSSTRRPSFWNSGPRWSMHRHVHGAQDAVGHRRRAGDLQEVAAGDARGILGHRDAPAHGPRSTGRLAEMNYECKYATAQRGGRKRDLNGEAPDARIWNGACGRSPRARSSSTAFSRGRYATDASAYQMMPLGVVVPRTVAEAERAHRASPAPKACRCAARRRHVAMRADDQRRRSIVDCSKHLNAHPRARRRETGAAWSSRASCSTS